MGRVTIAAIFSSSSCDVMLKIPHGVKNSSGIYTVCCCLLALRGTCASPASTLTGTGDPVCASGPGIGRLARGRVSDGWH